MFNETSYSTAAQQVRPGLGDLSGPVQKQKIKRLRGERDYYRNRAFYGGSQTGGCGCSARPVHVTNAEDLKEGSQAERLGLLEQLEEVPTIYWLIGGGVLAYFMLKKR